MRTPGRIPAGELATRLGGELVQGDPAHEVLGVRPLEAASAEHLAFLDAEKSEDILARSSAGVLLVARRPKSFAGGVIIVKNVRVAFARALALFEEKVRWNVGIDPRAIVDPSARLGEGVAVAAGAVIGADVEVGAQTQIHPGVVLYPGARVGASCVLHANVVIAARCVVGNRVIIHAGAVIGADGFGYTLGEDATHVKIPQVGIVVIEDDVEIGANACIDRATLTVTRVRRGVKIDNLVQIGHNCDIGEHSVICGLVGVGGSSTLEHHVVLGGQSGLSGHLTVGAGTQIGGRSGVHSDIPAGKKLLGSPAIEGVDFARMVAAMPRLPEILRRLRRLERRLGETEDEAAGAREE